MSAPPKRGNFKIIKGRAVGRPHVPDSQDCFPFFQESPRDAQASVRPRLWCDVRRAVAAHGLCRPFRNYLPPAPAGARRPCASLSACLPSSLLVPASVPATSSKRGRGGDPCSGVSPLLGALFPPHLRPYKAFSLFRHIPSLPPAVMRPPQGCQPLPWRKQALLCVLLRFRPKRPF